VREGYFYATLPLGSPAMHFSLIVDTGSTITYVPCHDCQHCGTNHYNQPYNPRSVLCGVCVGGGEEGGGEEGGEKGGDLAAAAAAAAAAVLDVTAAAASLTGMREVLLATKQK
jgi:hypothetical protein